jgi:hypothetical protein
MISLRTRNKSSFYLRAAMVIVTIVFGGIVFCGSNSSSQKSTAYNYGGLEEIEFYQALPGRMFLHQVSALCIPVALKFSPVVNLLGTKSSRPKTSYTLVRPSHAFNRTIAINAP